MKPFLGFSDKERMYFAMLHDRSELEASIKEGSLLLLGELEYLILIDNPKAEIEWSMEMGKDYFSFPITLSTGGHAVCYVSFDYERGFFPCVSNDRSDKIGRLAFVDALARNRESLGRQGAVIDHDGTLTVSDPGIAADKVTEAELAEWRKGGTDLYVGKIFSPADETFASRSILKDLHEAVRMLIRHFGKM